MTIIKPIFAILVVLAISALVALAGAQNSVLIGTLPLFVLCAAVGFILHWLVFVPSVIFQTEHYFDLTGSISYIATVALVVILHPQLDIRALVLVIMVATWAIRLGSFLFMRVKRDGRDRRFDEIKTKFWRFLFTWTLGGAWVFITMAASLAAMTTASPQPLDITFYCGLILWIAGFTIEVTADTQKTRFRAKPENKDKFITSGVWSRSRHPNYFGEIVLWIGVAVIAMPILQGWQWVTLISPIFVILLLTRVSGVNLLEKSAQERWGSDPAYKEYVANTPVLIPRLSNS